MKSERHTFRRFRDVYDFASKVLHAGTIKKKDLEKLTKDIPEVQELCRTAILRIVSAGAMPDWSDVVLGQGVSS